VSSISTEVFALQQMEYLAWNDLIAAHFFRPEMAGRRVHLYVTNSVLEEIGRGSHLGVDDFINAIKGGPPWATKRGLCQRALQAMDHWRERCLLYPPYVAYLALFVLAAGLQGDFSSNSYYPRLRTLLGEEPVIGQLPSFGRMWELWFDLEAWSNQDQGGALGLFFPLFAFNKWIHVGLPIAQTLLTDSERTSLRTLFAEIGLDPDSPPSDTEIGSLVKRHGRHKLRQQTLNVLEGSENDEGRHAVLIELIQEELREWDGVVTGIETSVDEAKIYGSLHLCAVLDTTAGVVTFTLRCRTRHEIPEMGLLLTVDGQAGRFRCDEGESGWSMPLTPESGGQPVDAAVFNWEEGITMKDSEQGWRLNLSPSLVRIFLRAQSQDLTGLVETRQLPKASPFYLAIRNDGTALLKQWGTSSCLGFKELAIREGLPQGWTMFRADSALDDEHVKDAYPQLALPSTIRLRFEGGIRASRANQFFSFAPPRIVVEGYDTSVTVGCNGIAVGCDVMGVCTLPEAASLSKELAIEAISGNHIIRRRLYLVEDFSWPSVPPLTKLTPFGTSFSGETNDQVATNTGALVVNATVPPFPFNSPVGLLEGRRVFFIGRKPGQVVTWPRDSLPKEWSPVWAIPMRQRGKAIFCGIRVSECVPLTTEYPDGKKLKEWKEVLWYHRKRIAPPEHKGLKVLWLQFQEAARRA